MHGLPKPGGVESKEPELAQIFSKSINKLPWLILVGASLAGLLVVSGIWYYFSPEYTDVGYRPVQPVEYSHKLHAGDLGIDCVYCHTTVERSAKANVPPTQTCMNCHTLIKSESEKLAPVRQSFATGEPIQWTRVHNLPGFAYFEHGTHVRAGVACITCHGNVAQMEVVTQMEPLSMGWCLECHRNPGENLRPVAEVTNMNWTPMVSHEEFAARMIKEKKIKPPVDCSGCHR